jgi:hypothetical protein
MKRHFLFFALMAAAISLLHFFLVSGLTHLVLFGSGGVAAFTAPVLWLLIAPMSFLVKSPFGRSLAPVLLQILFIANSVIWGSLFSGLVLWRQTRLA